MRSTMGDLYPDSSGSPVGIVRMNPAQSHLGVPALLKRVIDQSNRGAWEEIRAKIDYTYENLHCALQALEVETGFAKEIKARIGKGKKLFFKPNLVFPRNIDPVSHGEGDGSACCTDWPFL